MQTIKDAALFVLFGVAVGVVVGLTLILVHDVLLGIH
jgi:hypothetical protein